MLILAASRGLHVHLFLTWGIVRQPTYMYTCDKGTTNLGTDPSKDGAEYWLPDALVCYSVWSTDFLRRRAKLTIEQLQEA